MHERREIFYRLRLCIVEMVAWSEPTLEIHLLRSKFQNYIIVFFIRLDSSEKAFNLDGWKSKKLMQLSLSRASYFLTI